MSKDNNRTKEYIKNKMLEYVNDTVVHAFNVKDFTEYCGISRGTFYTYFTDIYDVTKYIYSENVLVPARSAISKSVSFDDVLIIRLDNMYKDKRFYIRNFRIYRNEELEAYILQQTHITHGIHYDYITSQQASNKNSLDKNTLNYTNTFYSYGLNAIIVKWINDGMELSPVELAKIFNIATNNHSKAYLQTLIK
ncbi:MAG: TetR/AcrR family transcriptional regulator [Eubacteriales bacterium]